MLKVCTRCKSRKLTTEFSKCNASKDKLQFRCKSCVQQIRKIIEVNCEDCYTVKLVRFDTYRLNGFWRCISCAQKHLCRNPEHIAKLTQQASDQYKKLGGIKNAHSFKSEDVRGEKAWNWKGGVTIASQRDRHSSKNLKWKREVLERDRFTCQLCDRKGGKLHVHHNKKWSDYPNLRYELINGITLCEDCHKYKAHRGSWKNDPIEWDELKEIYNADKTKTI